MDPHQANLQPNLLLPNLGTCLRFNPTPTFLGVTFDRTLFFSKHVSSLKAKFFPCPKVLRSIFASSWGPSLFCIKLFSGPFSHMLLPDSFFLKRYQYHQIGTPLLSGSSRHHRLLFVLPYPTSSLRGFFTSPTSYPDSFHSFIYERALCLPTSFPNSGLARLGVKPRLCRSSWRAFVSTHLLMLPSTTHREALLAFPSCPPWNLPSFTVESTLSSSYSNAGPPLFHHDAALAHLDSLFSHDVLIWTDGSVPFPFGKGGSGVFANCSLCGTETTYSFSAGPVCSCFSPETCAILHALCWSRQHQQVCHFSYLTLVLSSPPCPLLHLFSYLKLCGRSGRNCLFSPPVLSGYNGSLDTRFSWGTTWLMSWPDRDGYFCPLQILVVSFLLSLVSTLVFYRNGGILSHRSSLTHRLPRLSPRNLCSLATLTVSFLVYAATDTAFCLVFISLGLAESRILPAAPVDTRPRTPLISFCTVLLQTLCTAHSLSLYAFGSGTGELPSFWGSIVFCHAPIPQKG